jgi:hypothetical protein
MTAKWCATVLTGRELGAVMMTLARIANIFFYVIIILLFKDILRKLVYVYLLQLTAKNWQHSGHLYFASNPYISQRKLVHLLGISVVWLNYFLKSLMQKNLAKLKNLAHSKNKFSYLHMPPAQRHDRKGSTHRSHIRHKMS